MPMASRRGEAMAMARRDETATVRLAGCWAWPRIRTGRATKSEATKQKAGSMQEKLALRSSRTAKLVARASRQDQ